MSATGRRAVAVMVSGALLTAALTACGVGRAVSSARSIASGITSAAASSESSASTTASPSTPTVDVCSLVTAAQASSLTHESYDTTQTISRGAFSGCQYHNANTSDRGDTQDMDITMTTSRGCWSAATASDGPGTPVSGVGENASGSTLEFDVQSGDRCLVIEGQTAAESRGDWSADVAIAQLLLPALGAS